MSARVAALALGLALCACVSVDDNRPDRDAPGTGGTGGAGGTAGAGATGGGGGAAPGGSGGSDSRPPLNVDAIFENGCATASAEAELPQVNLLFVLDRSRSMRCNPPPTTTSIDCETRAERDDVLMPSKWDVTRDALGAAIRALPTKTVVGISYFSNGDACGVHSQPRIALRPLAREHIAAIDASLSSIIPSGATPLVGATILAYRHLHEGALEGRLRGDSFVVLLTDGEQSEECFDGDRCADKESCTEVLVNEEVSKASGPGVHIRTFVIGVPGSEPARSVLSSIAEQGGTAREGCDAAAGDCHFDMSKAPDPEALAADLAQALGQIVGRALSCELPLPEGTLGADRERVNVVYSPSLDTPRIIPRDDAPRCEDGANGWQYAPDAKSVRLCGQACEDARNDPAGRIDVVVGCPVQGPQ